MSVRWVPQPDQADIVRVSFAVRMRDLVTGEGPLGEPGIILEREQPAGTWTRIDPEPDGRMRASRTPSGLLAYVKLERKRFAAGLPATRYRFMITSPYYIPRFRAMTDWETVLVASYDNAGTLPPAPNLPVDVNLCPSLLYPFAAHIPVVHGTIIDKVTRKPLPDTLVFGGPAANTTITDERGRFGLPLLGADSGLAIPIGATDRLGRNGVASATLPGDLFKALNFTIPP